MTDQTTMIGDTMETDILGAVQLGFHSVLVLSGGAKREDLNRYAYRPDLVISSLAELLDLLEESSWQAPKIWTRPGPIKSEPTYATRRC